MTRAQQLLGAAATALLLPACVPSLGARAGGSIVTTATNPVITADVSGVVATRSFPVGALVASLHEGQSTRAVFAGAEANVPMSRNVSRDEYPQVLWGRTRVDLGWESLRGRSGATVRVGLGASYPFLVIPAADNRAWHVFQVSVEARAHITETAQLSAGPVLEYVFVPHGD